MMSRFGCCSGSCVCVVTLFWCVDWISGAAVPASCSGCGGSHGKSLGAVSDEGCFQSGNCFALQ